jgi:alpha-L-fucosidase
MAIPIPEKRIAEFENFGFGMFIHYGLYSQLGRGEWVLYIEKIPVPEYEKLAETFTASKFDARKIVSMAKAAGAKYVTLTTRHHEGFSLYDTKGLNTYDAPHSPCGRDLIREFVDACHEFDVVPFFYHTTLDWRDRLYKTDFKAYLQYLRDSVEVLCTQYGKIGGFWFDGNWAKPKGFDWEEDELYAVIRKHQPDAIIVNNTGTSSRGEAGHIELDSVTFEQGRPTPMDRDGMNKYYGEEMGPSIWKGKKMALISTCGYPVEKGADLWEEGVKRYAKHSRLQYVGMVCERQRNYGEQFMDEEKEAKMRAFAAQCMEACGE